MGCHTMAYRCEVKVKRKLKSDSILCSILVRILHLILQDIDRFDSFLSSILVGLMHFAPAPSKGPPLVACRLDLSSLSHVFVDSSDRSFDLHIELHAHQKDGRLNLFPGIPWRIGSRTLLVNLTGNVAVHQHVGMTF